MRKTKRLTKPKPFPIITRALYRLYNKRKKKAIESDKFELKIYIFEKRSDFVPILSASEITVYFFDTTGFDNFCPSLVLKLRSKGQKTNKKGNEK